MKYNKLFFAVSFSLFITVISGQTQKPRENILYAGFARTDITPSLPVKLYGYASRKDYSAGVHDPLSARVVIFQNNDKKIILLSSDLGSFGSEVFPDFRKKILEKYNLEESGLFLSTIHSHSSPVLSLDPGNGDTNNIKYTRLLQQKILDLIGAALKDLKHVKIGAGTGSSPVGSNRREMRPDGSVTLGRNPYGISDKEVLVLKVGTPEGNTCGALFNYATHSTSLGARNMLISGDILGLAAQFTEKILGKGIVTPVFAGASGDIDPWYRVLPEFNSEPGWIPEPILLATLLGEEVIHVYRRINVMNSGSDINTAFATIDCPGRKTSGNGNSSDKPSTVPVNITVARIGDDVAFVGFNVEMLTDIGMKIKGGSPFRHTFIITHCNGYSGYLVPPELYKEGGYEVNTTRFEIGSSEMVVKKTLSMLYDL